MKNNASRARVPATLRWIRRAALRVCTSIGVLFVVVTVTPVDHWWATALAGPWQSPSGEVLIVLGGSWQDYGTVGGSSYWRGIYAARAWKQGGFRQVVIAGGGAEGASIAEALRDFLTYQGVPWESIRLETRSNTTRENAVFTKELLTRESGPKVLLTSDYHMYRARRAFEKVGVEVLPWPYPDVRKRVTRWAARWPAFLDLVVETSKIIYYHARGWT